MTRIEFKYKNKEKNIEVKIKEDSFTIHSDTLMVIQKILDFEKEEKKDDATSS